MQKCIHTLAYVKNDSHTYWYCGSLLAGAGIFKMNPLPGRAYVDLVSATNSYKVLTLHNEEKNSIKWQVIYVFSQAYMGLIWVSLFSNAKWLFCKPSIFRCTWSKYYRWHNTWNTKNLQHMWSGWLQSLCLFFILHNQSAKWPVNVRCHCAAPSSFSFALNWPFLYNCVKSE